MLNFPSKDELQLCSHGEIRSDSRRHEMIYANEILTHNKMGGGEDVGTFMGTECWRRIIIIIIKKNKHVARNQPKQCPGWTGLGREADPQKLPEQSFICSWLKQMKARIIPRKSLP